jgi:hypothetical protein
MRKLSRSTKQGGDQNIHLRSQAIRKAYVTKPRDYHVIQG